MNYICIIQQERLLELQWELLPCWLSEHRLFLLCLICFCFSSLRTFVLRESRKNVSVNFAQKCEKQASRLVVQDTNVLSVEGQKKTMQTQYSVFAQNALVIRNIVRIICSRIPINSGLFIDKELSGNYNINSGKIGCVLVHDLFVL